MKTTLLFRLLLFGGGAFSQQLSVDTIPVSLAALTVNAHIERVTLGPKKKQFAWEYIGYYIVKWYVF